MTGSVEHEPVVTRATARFCGQCGQPIMFDPDTLRPWHVPPVPSEPVEWITPSSPRPPYCFYRCLDGHTLNDCPDWKRDG